MIMAQKKQLEINENARLLVVNKLNEAQVKVLVKAHIVLQKYTSYENMMSDKDWGDIIHWVLPEAKVDFRLKELKKEQILTKLATLPRQWTTYIPPRIVITPNPTTTTV